MKHFLFVTLVLVASAGCEKVESKVLCEIKQGPSVECAVTQTKGKAEIEVCWNYKAECANKATLSAPKMCAKVKDGGSTTTTASGDKLVISGACEGGITGAVTDLTINGDAAK
ncbi:MAG: hypothetical protein ACKV2T_27595 [Kofleriaceae bacterium]